MVQKGSKIAKDILRRVRWLYFLFALVALSIFARILWIQYGPSGAELREKAVQITFERVAIEADRGDILASDGRLLATSIPTYEIRMDFAAAGLTNAVFDSNVDSLATLLSQFFKDRTKEQYKKVLTNYYKDRYKSRYKLISPRRVDYLEERKIREFPLFRLGKNKGGYIKVQVNKRLLPHGSLAQRTIGMTNLSGVRVGIEGSFDNQLRGEDGSTLMQRVSGSFKVPVSDPLNVEPINGQDVLTTLNIDIQDVAEAALKNQLKQHNSDWGTVVLMEVSTGEVHAMANLTRQPSGRYEEDFNYAIGRRMEPGSTFKLATLIALVDDAGMSVERMIDCEGGRAVVGNRMVVDTHRDRVVSLKHIFGVSSNVGFAKAVHEVYEKDPARFLNYIGDNLGFRSRLGIEIEGEREPLIKSPTQRVSGEWDPTTLVMMSYGYALEITPIQTLALYNAVANNGKMVQPRLVREIQSYGETRHKYSTRTINSAICSKNTIKIVRDCLENVVDAGTGSVLKSPNYSVAAKTGTAQVAFDRGGYVDSRGGHNYLATMVGYFPADNPKYSCIVAIKTYNGPGARNLYYGAPLAGPVFKAIADRVYASNSTWHEAVNSRRAENTQLPTEIKSGKSSDIKNLTRELNIPIKIARKQSEWSYIGDSVVNGVLQSRSAERVDGVTPSVIGMGLKDALYLLESSGFRVTFAGRGRVASQSVEPGEVVSKGQNIYIVMRQ